LRGTVVPAEQFDQISQQRRLAYDYVHQHRVGIIGHVPPGSPRRLSFEAASKG
jgi:hypothetical protein